MSNRNQIVLSFIVVFLIILSISVFYSNSFQEEIGVCGTPDYITYNGKILNENQTEGRKLFKSLCASCHKIDRRLVGPALANENLTFDYFYQYSINEKKLLDSLNIQALETTKSYVSFSYEHTFNQLKKENVKMIYDYVNMAYLD
ncbi:hypothetical protein LPB03_12370 [Polaribacter vadi]|mgnify:CR=1 FL=1|uniref:Cytochrome c domain-containing protein n=1 Tax=Polaribacter vadi TaxID=1774273 RepID=A0A1B8TTT1_9FLAO|nr:cytochrome c [Polaribacter vadi]AOW18197.1 hypothetical protein LPB03_12370 [Polaribacter vadi]OBY62929.1 hypothetical protein LPB3_12385 [Polaribacter vadi]